MVAIMSLRPVKQFTRNCDGAVTLEFALVSITIIILAPFLYDLSSVASSFMSLSGSTRAGLQYALKNPSDSVGIASVIQNASGFPANSVVVTNTQSCECSGLIAVCGSSCAGGGNPAYYQTIKASYNVPTMLPYSNYPNNSFTISNAVTVRVQ